MRAVLLIVAGCSGPTPIELTEPSDPLCPSGRCVPDPEGEEVRNGWANVAVDPDGGAWMVFAQASEQEVTGLYLARSPSAGAPLTEPELVPTAEPPNVGTTEKPTIAVDRERVAIAYTGTGLQRHGEAHALYVQIGIREGEAVRFEPPRIIDRTEGPEERVLEQVRVALAPDGELWVLWKRQRYGRQDVATWARERDGFAPVEVSPELSHDHDCSPPDFRFGPSGSLLVGLRSNMDGWLQTVAIVADPASGAIDELVQVSDDRWRYDDLVCPEDGPRLVELADGTLFAAWMAPAGIAWRLFSSWSTDGGRTWTAPAFDHEGVDLGETWVSVAATEAGPFHVAVEGLDRTSRLLTREVPGGPAAERWLLGEDGSDLVDVEIASAAGRTAAVGMTGERVLWLLDL